MRIIAHPVKCYYCGHVFDRDKIAHVAIEGKKRYAHTECHQRSVAAQSADKQSQEDLENYIKELFGYKTLPEKVNRQIRQFTTENNYTYSGILKSLKYFYEIKGGSKDKANGAIGIVPWIYDEAYRYYYALWEARQKNERVDIEKYVLPTVEIKIAPPQRKPMKTRKVLFTFLEEESENK